MAYTIENAYITGATETLQLEEVKHYLTIQSTEVDAEDDDLIKLLINAASRWVDRHTSKTFYDVTDTRTFAAQWTDRLSLNDDYLLSVTTLKTDEDADDVFEQTWTTDDYRLFPFNSDGDTSPYTEVRTSRNGRVSFPASRNHETVEIAGEWGYNLTGSHPPQIETAVMLIVKEEYRARTATESDSQAIVTGGGIVIRPAMVPARVFQLLSPFKSLT